MLLLLFALAALALGLAYAALRARYAYWKRRGVTAPECTAPFGNYADAILGRAGMGDVMFDVYQKYRDQRYVGTHFLGTPLLQLHDPEIIRQVFVREFQDFNGRAMYSEPDKDMISGQLFMLSGQPWRNLRVKLSPTFTTGKLRLMFSTFKKCGDQLREHIASQVRADGGRTHIDVKELLARFGTDIITSVAFGIDTNTLANPKSEFRRISGLILDPSIGMSVRAMLAFMWPNALRMLPTTLFPAEANEFFLNTVTELVEYREKHGVDRADMLQLLIKLKNDGFVPPDAPGQVADEKEAGGEESIADADAPVEKQRISIREIGAQCAVFFLAGFETTSATNTFALYLLAKHPEVQDKVVAEMREALDRHGGEISYDTLVNLPYTDMVLNETMRLYPAVPFLNREAMRERTLPLTDLVLDKGTRLMIPVRALHMDPKHWEHPEEFNPERFTKDKVEARHPMVYLPFGDGPRICIGMRMALIQMKMALMTILTRAEVALPADAPSTIKLSPHTITPTPVDTLKLVFTERAD
ncbi:Cytochrome P450 CYP6 [Frankliniella occidentalis]|uniref:Probable cytochrome P450 6a13 n=1 Tax=Frankliniella occidentalis TaxID=133901 RepID=A0A9C6U4A5_FRAOC|nr:probable cytochrome P450 6a13 [Frankliniella occidentalis]KAE8749572.1 Cytochrome P450 CYP6 [Frankliniella occidentalis]